MCGGPSGAEKAAARAQQEAAQAAKKKAIEERSQRKREDIDTALEGRTQSEGRRGGTGRRSLFSATGGSAGFIGRFN